MKPATGDAFGDALWDSRTTANAPETIFSDAVDGDSPVLMTDLFMKMTDDQRRNVVVLRQDGRMFQDER